MAATPSGRRESAGRNRIMQWMLAALAGFIALGTVLWAGLAAWYGPLPRLLALLPVSLGLGVQVWLCLRLRPFWRASLACLGISLLLVAAWQIGLRPSNQRQWQPDVARTAYASFDGRKVTVHNVRNCHYRSATDFDIHYEDRTYDLNGLQSADLFLVDWGLHTIAHTMFSFGFADGQQLCFSIETRKEIGEGYSASKGFFRNYELIYIAADERDLVRLRTNFRKGEEVFLYRLKPKKPEAVEAVFVEYLQRLNQLHQRPEWYNALTENCMTSGYKNIRKHAVKKNWDWRILANGHAAELAYEEGTVYTGMPYPALKAASIINDKARAVADGADFSAAIRQGLPGMTTASDPGQK